MIVALLYTGLFALCGVFSANWLLPRHRPLNRLWVGLCLGLLEEMWLPALGAFWLSFTWQAHAFGAAALLALTFVCYFFRDRRPPCSWDETETRLLRQLLLVALPLTMLSGYLQYTHVMRVDGNGAWHVGQSTYGDLPMHLSFITGLVGKKFPADYPFFPGARLSYPFLTDALSSTFVLFGASLQGAVICPAVWMMALCYAGGLVLAREMTAGRKTAVLAVLLFFLNGGLGFLYDFDLAGGMGASGRWTVEERVRAILEGYYKTPTNQPDPHNLRWSNVICDLMIPQRTLLGGWCMVFPCFYLLETGFHPAKRGEGTALRERLLLSVWGGALPLIHTHSFLALALASAGCLGYDLLHTGKKNGNGLRSRGCVLIEYAVYGAVAAALALPQLFAFTFAQTFQETNHSFLQFQFNWVNNPSGRGMRDLYFWFYIKNIGLPFIALLLALLEKDPRKRRLFAAALPIIVAAELIRFQPNEYDNNKLFYLAWFFCCMIVADWAADVWLRLKGLRCRGALAALLAVATFLSTGLTIWRECVSDYVAFGPGAVEAGEFAGREAEPDAVFLTGLEHLNPVVAIGGKTVVCGPNLWLYWHGFDISERAEDIASFLEQPEMYSEVLDKYGVDYVYISSYERSDYAVDEAALRRLYPVAFENGEATVYRVAGH